MGIDEYYVKIWEIYFNSDEKGSMVFDAVLPYMYLGEVIRAYGSSRFYIEIKRKED